MTEIEWINHASYVMRAGDITLVCDPWLEGTAFKDGWRHYSPTTFGYDRFKDVTHIWISHQHPDHFAPTNLKKLAPEDRKRITVLYQETEDKLVVSWLRANGYANTKEVRLQQWIPLGPDLQIQVGTLNDDSWLAARVEGRTILNVNDCVLKKREPIEAIAAAVGPVDVLLTQFSYAQWVGNPPDADKRRADAKEKYDRIRLQDEIFKPACIVPFASYIYFCHDENFFLNDSVNRVSDIASFIEIDLRKTPVVLYPGDRWNVDEAAPTWRQNAERYNRDLDAALEGGPTNRVNSVAQPAVTVVGNFLDRLTRKNPIAPMLLRGHRATVYLTDAKQTIEITSRGVRAVAVDEAHADLATSSENVLYAFRTPWGGNTLHVSGRFVSYVPGGHLRFFRLVDQLHHYNVTPINFQWAQAQGARVARGIARRITSRLPSASGTRVG